MADMARLKEAFIEADKAGDTKSAAMFAQEIRKAQAKGVRRQLAIDPQAQSGQEKSGFSRFSQSAIASTVALPDLIGELSGARPPGQLQGIAEEAGITTPDALRRTDAASVAGRIAPYVLAGLARGPTAAATEALSAVGAFGGEMAGQAIGGQTGALIGGLAGAILTPFGQDALKGAFSTQGAARDLATTRAATGAPVGFAESTRPNEVSGVIKQIEAVSGRMLGGRGASNRQAQRLALASYRKADELARKLNPNQLGAEDIGLAIQKGFDDDYARFQTKAGHLYDDVEKWARGTRVRPNNTRKVLRDLEHEVSGAGEFAKAASSSRAAYVRTLITGFTEDLMQTGGRFDYKKFQGQRRNFGEIINSKSAELIGSDRQQIAERVWGGIQKDMDILAAVADQDARRVGHKSFAVRDMNKAKNFYREGIRRLTLVNKQVIAKDIPSDIARAAYRSKEKPELMRALRDSLPRKQWEAARGMFIDDMGRVNPGRDVGITIADDGAGLSFGMENFLTSFQNIRKGRTLDILFPGQLGADLNQIAKVLVGSRLKVARNPNMSGTAQAGADLALAQTGAASVVAGKGYVKKFLKASGAYAAAGRGGQWITSSPAMINWVARSTVLPAAQLPGHLEKLFDVVSKEPHMRDIAVSIVEQIKGPLLDFDEQYLTQ